MVYSTPAGERKRPRVRRGHVEKTRGRIWPLPRRGLKLRDHVPKCGHILLKAGGLAHLSRSVIVTLATRARRKRSPNGYFARCQDRPNYLSAACERRQNLNPYRRGERPFEICRMSRQSVDQHRTCLDDVVEMRIRPLIAGQSKGFSNGSGLEPLLRYPCCGSCPSPIMKGNGHPCVSLKHAFRPFLEVG
ncbi:MAG: hypothetical protein K0R13_2442 [Propionibacteriaceae bacterium]|nr:hypothetical protein [Propionibacteriaceae bacterium]